MCGLVGITASNFVGKKNTVRLHWHCVFESHSRVVIFYGGSMEGLHVYELQLQRRTDASSYIKYIDSEHQYKACV
jgi:hypothetical protein